MFCFGVVGKQRVLFVVILSFVSAVSMKASFKDSYKEVAQISKELQKRPLDRGNENRFSKQLRTLVSTMAIKEDDVLQSKVIDAFLEMRKNIRSEYLLSITDEEYESAGNSVGVALLLKDIATSENERYSDEFIEGFMKDGVIDALIREASCLSAPAQKMLEYQYDHPYPIKGWKPYDAKILDFFKTTAEEGTLPASQYVYGEILLKGLGTKKNEAKGLFFLEGAGKAGMPEAYQLIAEYYIGQKDMVNFEKYLRLGADQKYPRSMYNLAILEQNKKNYAKAVDLLKKTIEIKPDYYSAQLELGRMYVEGWGIKKDERKGFQLIEQVALSSAEDKETLAMACMNVGIFYKKGIGTIKSLARAKEYFEKALTLGFSGARDFLNDLDQK